MILSLSTWIDGVFVHHPAVDIGPNDKFTPPIARAALLREFGKHTNSIAWCGDEGYRFFRNTFKKVHRHDHRADPRHYETWDSFEYETATDVTSDFPPDQPADFRGD